MICLVMVAVSCGAQIRQQILIHIPSRYVNTAPKTFTRRAMEWSMLNPPLACRTHRHIMVGRMHGNGSLSIGTVTNGYIVNPVMLPLTGRDYRVMDRQAKRATNFGVSEMVDLVKRTAKSVAETFPGSVMQVANMAACGGGEIPWSVSHHSGRDVDIAFYLLNLQGKQAQLSDMVAIGPDGTGMDDTGRVLTFDPARNWAMIKAIITDPHVSVQWIFIAHYLKRRLLQFAMQHGEPRSLIIKASQVMWQPHGSSAHSDHIHVRIYCPVDDLMEGCHDIGTNRPWYVDHSDLVARRVAELSAILRQRAGLAAKAQALDTLGAIGTPEAHQAIVRMLGSRAISLRRAAAHALFRWGTLQADLDAMFNTLEGRVDGITALYLMYALKRYKGPGRCEAMCRLMGIHKGWTVPAALGLWRFRAPAFAAKVLALRGEVPAIPSLIRCLKDNNAMDRNACVQALHRITNRTLIFNAMSVQPAVLWHTWSDWYAGHRDATRKDLLVSGFAISGVLPYASVNSMTFSRLDLVALYREALTNPHPYNAYFLLARLTHTGLWLPRNSMHSRLFFLNQRLMKRAVEWGLALPHTHEKTGQEDR